ncbi:MAG: GcrA family cell cycle regulator [Bdellovibrionales bacterium]
MTSDAPREPSLDQEERVSQQPLQDAGLSGVGPSWQEQDDVLRQLWNENKSPEEIATILGRSVAAVMTRAARIGLPRRAAPGRKRGYKRSETKRKVLAAAGTRVRVAVPTEIDEDHESYEPPEVKMRVCLMCLKKFQSQGRHNRICPACKGSADYATGSSTPDFTFKVLT